MSESEFTKLLMVNLEESGFYDMVPYDETDLLTSDKGFTIRYKGREYLITVQERIR